MRRLHLKEWAVLLVAAFLILSAGLVLYRSRGPTKDGQNFARAIGEPWHDSSTLECGCSSSPHDSHFLIAEGTLVDVRDLGRYAADLMLVFSDGIVLPVNSQRHIYRIGAINRVYYEEKRSYSGFSVHWVELLQPAEAK